MTGGVESAPGLLVNVDVEDLERGVAFYRDGLGLAVGRRFGDSAVEMVGAAVPVYLLRRPPGTLPFAGADRPREYVRHWTPVHLDVVVDDLEPAVQRAVAAGASVEGEPRDAPWGSFLTMADPFGHALCLLQFRGRGYDEIATSPGESRLPAKGARGTWSRARRS